MVSNYEQDIAQSYSQWYQDTTSNSYSNGNSDSSDNSNSYCNSQQNVIKKMMAYQKFNSNYTIVPETTTEASEENKSDGNSETKLTARNIDESLAQDIGVDLEIAFRCLLDKLLQNFTVEVPISSLNLLQLS